MNKNIKQSYLKKIYEFKKHNKFYYENSSPNIANNYSFNSNRNYKSIRVYTYRKR